MQYTCSVLLKAIYLWTSKWIIHCIWDQAENIECFCGIEETGGKWWEMYVTSQNKATDVSFHLIGCASQALALPSPTQPQNEQKCSRQLSQSSLLPSFLQSKVQSCNRFTTRVGLLCVIQSAGLIWDEKALAKR